MALAPVIEIPVDDSAFKKFSEAFEEYTSKLKKMPADWQAINTRIGELAKVQRTLGVSADRAWSNAVTAANNYEKAVKSATSSQHKLGKSVSASAISMKSLANDAKGFAKSMGGLARDLAKFSLFGIGAGLLGSGGLTFGLDALANGVLERQRTARGLGLNVGQLNSFRVNMRRYAGMSVLTGAAQAQNDLSQMPWLATLGIRYSQAQGESATALAGQEIMAVHRAYLANPSMILNTPAGMAAQKLGFTPQDIRNIGLASPTGLQSAINATRSDAGALGLSNQVQREWANFAIQLQKAGVLIETALINTLTPLTPQLTELSRKFADLITGLGKSDDVKKWVGELSQGIHNFANWVGSPAFQQDLRTIAYYFGKIAGTIGGVARFLYGDTPPAPGENNPLNLKNMQGAFRGFKTPQAGVVAAYNNMLTYPKNFHTNTLGQMIAVWNGHGANSAAYAAAVSKASGVGVNAPVPFANDQKMAAIISAMSKVEGNHYVTPAEALKDIQSIGVQATLAGLNNAVTLGTGALPISPEEAQHQASIIRLQQAARAENLEKSRLHPVPAPVSPTRPAVSDVLQQRNRYWATHGMPKITVQNNTAAQVQISGNAANAQ